MFGLCLGDCVHVSINAFQTKRSQTIVQLVDFDNCILHEQLKVALTCCSEGFHFNSKQCSYFF